MKRKIIFGILAFLILLVGIGIYVFMIPNVQQEKCTIVIPHDATFEQVVHLMEEGAVLKDVLSFKVASKCLLYKSIRQGKYTFSRGENNFTIVMKLRRGQHYPVKFTFNNIRTKAQLIEKVDNRFLFTANDLETLLEDELFLQSHHLTSENVIAVFIPNTYEFYYDITAEEFFNRMYSYWEKFWTKERVHLAEEINLTPIEVSILASIVEEENYKESEKSIIAGLYINRLRIDMALESDPTVKFAVGDFSLKRIYKKHCLIDSPYNTYLYKGLPPGPIRIPESSTLDSVLHYQHHNYLFMCAKEDLSGYHRFAESYEEHLKNAKRYQDRLNQQQ